MRLVFLGTGTSTGVPQMRCHCPTCTSTDPRDNRLRASAMLQIEPGSPWLLIDCGPDFRQQMLRAGSPELAAALLTHIHYDHVGGIDDLRPYTHSAPNGHFPVYCRYDVATDMRTRMPYSFARKLYPGVPTFDIHEIDAPTPFFVEIPRHSPVEILPLRVMHATLPIIGFRFGKLAYITDCSFLPDETFDALKDVEILVINALRYEPHTSHINLPQALEIIAKVNPRQAYLTHIAHNMGRHLEVEPTLPLGVKLAFDGLEVAIKE